MFNELQCAVPYIMTLLVNVQIIYFFRYVPVSQGRPLSSRDTKVRI